ncbi:TonB-dependent receptor [Tsuneonella sp. CC-YZS046]|uniref:TonB-dependent receptor n=1 Tax=Tsuneonella sp. CC-YZS046 TaxID=3042152 RepID=UPI002D771A2B|nr:TonB-dependent receptor [Tsuneonella sp. CC-YZS046]WRO67033.1 TonB-dependent receptor [Tsuneonella sp. CC-YZS046]
MAKSTSIPSFLALGCVSAMAFTSGAHAQDSGETQRLGGVTVTDTAIDESEVKAERAASPKYTAPLLDTPQTITVITNKSIQQQNLLTLRDVLQTVPGITFGAGEGGFGYGDRIILRGQDAKNDVTIDGVRSSAFLNRNETYNIEQIEVTNGANSVYSGGGSVAGTINLVTKKPLADDQTVVSAGIGTDDYYRGTVDANLRLNELIAIRLNAVYHENDVPGRDVEFYERWGVAPAITIGIDNPTNLTLQYEHLDDKGMPQYGLRYYANLGGYLSDFDRSGYYGFANLDQQNSKTNALQAIFSHEFSDSINIRNLTRYEKIKQNTITSQPTGTFCLASTGKQPGTFAVPPVEAACPATIPEGYYLPTGGRGVQRLITNETLYNQFDISADFDTGGIAHSLVLGASALWEDYSQNQGTLPRNADGSTPAFPLVNIANPGEIVQGPAGFTYGSNVYTGPINFIRTSYNRGERKAFAAYLFDTMKFGEMFELNGGIRYEHAKGHNSTISYVTTAGAPNLGDVNTTTGPFRNSDNLFSYRIGAVFKPTPDTSLYIATGTSKNPSQAAVDGACSAANCNLKPETTKNYEVGAKADLFGKRLLVSAAWFRNDRDSIRINSNDPTLPDQRLDGKQRVEGISLGASGNITENWTISANYMYLKSKIRQGVSDFCIDNPGATGCNNSATFPDPTRGYALTNTPKHSGSLFTTYRFPFGLELGYGITYQGKYLLNQPTLAQLVADQYVGYYVPSYTIHRFMASYPITERLTAQVNVQNFTNEKYVTTVRNQLGGSWAQPAPTRSAVLSVNYTF